MRGVLPTRPVPAIPAIACTILILVAIATIAHAGADLIPRHVPNKPAHSQLWPELRDDLIIVKFVDADPVRLRGGHLVSMTGRDLTEANRLLAENPNLNLDRLFSRPETSLEEDRLRAQVRSGKEMADLNNYYQVRLAQPSVEAIEALLDGLNARAEVEIAYAEPIPQLAVIDEPQASRVRDRTAVLPTPNFQDMQDYMEAAPTGIDAYAAWGYSGGRGETVKIIDIEIGWNWNHEDMKPPFYQSGENVYGDHGIAVLGIISAVDNGYGVTGIANEVEVGSACVLNIPTAEVFDQVVSQLDPGDIFVIELHCPGPAASGYGQDGYIALEWWQANFDAIAMGTANGVICCEAAGNGAEDFDDPIYEGRFDRNVRDSGAIIVGATNGASLNPASFTNHGSRVDLAGWGYDVVTTGYGDLQGGPQNEWYTAGFSGTSSATPIVTGAVAAMQGIYKAHSGGTPLSGNTIAQILRDTGTPTNGPQQIGPRPNLALGVPAMLNDLAEIAGTVTDTADPIEGAEIRIIETGTRATTAADGSYSLLISEGSWTVRCESFGCVQDESTVETTAGATTPHDVSLAALPTSLVSGVVVDENGAPIPEALVRVADTPLDGATTGANGAYEISDVPSPFIGTLVATATGLTPDIRKLLVLGLPPHVDLRLAHPNDFESYDGDMTPSGDWQWGTPSYESGPDALSGEQCWGTNLTGNYGTGSDHRLTTPEYDLTDMNDPRLSFWQWYSIWGPYDGINVMISTDAGSNWEVIEPVDGYDDPCIDGLPGNPCPPGWTGASHGWVPAVFDLRHYEGEMVSFRFTLGTWGYTGSPGWYIDDFQVHGAQVSSAEEPTLLSGLFFGRPSPTPSTGSVAIDYGLDQTGKVDARIYDAAGRLVRRLVNHTVPAGTHILSWDGRNDQGSEVRPGIYFVHLLIASGGNATAEFTRKTVILR